MDRREALKVMGAVAGSLPLSGVDWGDPKGDSTVEASCELMKSCEECSSILENPPYQPETLQLKLKEDSRMFRWPLVFDLNADLGKSTLLETKNMRRQAGLSRIKLWWDDNSNVVEFNAHCWPVDYASMKLVTRSDWEVGGSKWRVWLSSDPVYREFQLTHDIDEYWIVGQARDSNQAVDCVTDQLVAGEAYLHQSRPVTLFNGVCDVLVPADFSDATKCMLNGWPRANMFVWDSLYSSHTNTTAQHWVIANAGKHIKEWTYYGMPLKGISISLYGEKPSIEPIVDYVKFRKQMLKVMPKPPVATVPQFQGIIVDYAAFEFRLFVKAMEDQLISRMGVPKLPVLKGTPKS